MTLLERLRRWLGPSGAETAEAEQTMSDEERREVVEGPEGEAADLKAERSFKSFYDDAGEG